MHTEYLPQRTQRPSLQSENPTHAKHRGSQKSDWGQLHLSLAQLLLPVANEPFGSIYMMAGTPGHPGHWVSGSGSALVSFKCQLDTAQSHVRGKLLSNNCFYQVDLWVCLSGTVLTINWHGNAQPTVGATIPRQLFLGSQKKQDEHEPVFEAENKQHFSTVYILSFCPEFCLSSDGL